MEHFGIFIMDVINKRPLQLKFSHSDAVFVRLHAAAEVCADSFVQNSLLGSKVPRLLMEVVESRSVVCHRVAASPGFAMACVDEHVTVRARSLHSFSGSSLHARGLQGGAEFS